MYHVENWGSNHPPPPGWLALDTEPVSFYAPGVFFDITKDPHGALLIWRPVEGMNTTDGKPVRLKMLCLIDKAEKDNPILKGPLGSQPFQDLHLMMIESQKEKAISEASETRILDGMERILNNGCHKLVSRIAERARGNSYNNNRSYDNRSSPYDNRRRSNRSPDRANWRDQQPPAAQMAAPSPAPQQQPLQTQANLQNSLLRMPQQQQQQPQAPAPNAAGLAAASDPILQQYLMSRLAGSFPFGN